MAQFISGFELTFVSSRFACYYNDVGMRLYRRSFGFITQVIADSNFVSLHFLEYTCMVFYTLLCAKTKMKIAQHTFNLQDQIIV